MNMKRARPSIPSGLTLRILASSIVVSIFMLSILFFNTRNFTASAQTGETLRNPTELVNKPNPRRGGDVNFDLNIIYGDNKIPNPSTGNSDPVHLRSYNGELVGPTMRVRTGQL